MRILLVEDDSRVIDFLVRGLKAERHIVTVARSGDDGLEVALTTEHDVILLDLMLPGMRGHEVCQTLRQRGILTPVLMLTALDTVKDRVEGLRLGADDYMTKPFAFDELLARIEALSRRAANFRAQESTLKFGPIQFDRQTLEVRKNGELLRLTARELAILEILMTRPGKIFSRESLLSNVWGVSEDPMTNVVDVYVARLRKRIDGESGPSLIETVRGLGYRLNADIRGQGRE